MARRTEIKCPFCGAAQLKVRTCKEVETVCHECGASLLLSKNEDGSILVSARPHLDQKAS